MSDVGPNGTAIDAGDTVVVVERGPTWLARLLYAPPEWLVLLLEGLLLVGLAATLWALRRVEIDAELVTEWLEVLTVVGAIAGATWLLTLTALPYLAVVVGGVTAGYAGAQVVLRSGALEELARAVVGE